MIDKIVQHWGVDVRINGERVLTIEKDSLSGIENISDYADTVRECAEHLLAFIGSKEPAPLSPKETQEGKIIPCSLKEEMEQPF